jgi:DNA gyrase inhibitor GyrI
MKRRATVPVKSADSVRIEDAQPFTVAYVRNVGPCAGATFELDPREYGAAWNWQVGTWFPSSGYQPDDRLCFETCGNEPEKHLQKNHQVETWEPVRLL